MRAKLDQFKMQVAGGTILGGASVQGLDEPKQASFDFSADYLDLDKILGEKKGGDDDDDAAPEHGKFRCRKCLKAPRSRRQDQGRVGQAQRSDDARLRA